MRVIMAPKLRTNIDMAQGRNCIFLFCHKVHFFNLILTAGYARSLAPRKSLQIARELLLQLSAVVAAGVGNFGEPTRKPHDVGMSKRLEGSLLLSFC
jgi:hypothetical protein